MQTYDMNQSMKGKAVEDHESASKMTEEAPMPKAAGGSAGMKIDRVEIRPTENGGFVVNCSKSKRGGDGANAMGPGGYENKDYAFSSLPEAMAFVQQEFGGGEAGTLEQEGMEAEA